MLIEKPQPLPNKIQMPCYACEVKPATHVCRFKVGELAIQVCLCPDCMKIDTRCLLKNTVGIQGIQENTTGDYAVQARPRI